MSAEVFALWKSVRISATDGLVSQVHLSQWFHVRILQFINRNGRHFPNCVEVRLNWSKAAIVYCCGSDWNTVWNVHSKGECDHRPNFEPEAHDVAWCNGGADAVLVLLCASSADIRTCVSVTEPKTQDKSSSKEQVTITQKMKFVIFDFRWKNWN